jgi:hypothetical protein
LHFPFAKYLYSPWKISNTKCKYNAKKIAVKGGVKKVKNKLVKSFMDGPLESMTKRSEATEAVEKAHEAPHHP